MSRRVSWLLGLALLGTVVAVVARRSEAEAFVRVAQEAEPWWLLLAVGLQAGTYVVHGQVWRHLARAAGHRLPWHTAARVSLAKLFIDQALPSGGISGTLLAARALSVLGLSRPAVMAAVVVNTASHYVAYLLSLLVALGLAAEHRRAHPALVWVAAVFTIFAATVATAVLVLAGPRAARLARRLRGKPAAVARVLGLLADADPSAVHRPGTLLAATLCQLGVVALDAATLWTVVRAVGAEAAPAGVFASFMVSSLVRTVGVLPAGLGTFEAASVVTLGLIGLDLPAALSATMLFRGLSLWAPLPLGAWCARSVATTRPAR